MRDGMAVPPKNVIMLTADAFGVLPPIARLTREQAMYHFISGYTAKVAGTERGVTEPSATFSPLFGAPFMSLHPTVYADLFGSYLDRSGAKVWLVNTGWTGGRYGVGERISIKHSRAVVRAALTGELDDVAVTPDPMFGVGIPSAVPGVPPEVLHPRETWTDPADYDTNARELAGRFVENFAQYADLASGEVLAASPNPNG